MERRSFVKSSGALAAVCLMNCAKVYRPTRPRGVLKQGQDGLLANRDELSDQTVTLVYSKQGPILLVRQGENVRAFASICPHTGCEVNDGIGTQNLVRGEIRCWIHDSYFDAETGKYIAGPADPKSKLKSIEIEVRGNRIFLAG